VGRRRVNEGDEGDRIWLMDFMYLHEIETFCNCFKWGEKGAKGGELVGAV
jgi:hypothetical protein